MIAVGIDVGKRHHEACFLDATGQEVGAPLRFAHNRAGLQLLQARLHALPEPATVAMEASGHYWLGVERYLRDANVPVQVINPLQVSAFRTTGVRRTKTDRRDAFVVADLLRIGRTRPNYVPDDTILQLRLLVRFRWSLADRIGDTKRSLLAVLDRVFPEFADQFNDPFGTSARALLARASSAAEFAELDLAELTAVLERASRKRFGEEKAAAVRDSAVDSLGVAALGPVGTMQVQALIGQLNLFEGQTRESDAVIAELLAERAQHLTSIPGIGPVLAGTILAEIGDVHRFPRLEALVAYAGIDPSVFESGQFHATRQHISKRGSPHLRRALFLAAHSAQLRNPELHAYLERKMAEGKLYKVALIAVAREEQRPYEPRQ
ncbi:MAG: IS110 family transposase [Dehalococcoidia bacterium]